MASSTSASAASASRPDPRDPDAGPAPGPTGWVRVCRLERIPPDAGVCALVGGEPVAIFRVGDRVWAIGDRDPFTGASVLSRGIVGDRGGVLKVASPLHKQSFALETGACLDDPAVSVPVFRCRVVDGVVEVVYHGPVSSGLRIEVRPAGDVTRVTIAGTVDERADFGALETVGGKVELYLHEVRRFNSVGVRFWMDAMRGLVERARLVTVHECSRAVVDQLNMIRGFLGSGSVRSFHAPMRCEPCDHDVDQLYRAEDCGDGLPETPCPRCGRPLELDDMEDSYLLFLREPTTIR